MQADLLDGLLDQTLGEGQVGDITRDDDGLTAGLGDLGSNLLALGYGDVQCTW